MIRSRSAVLSDSESQQASTPSRAMRIMSSQVYPNVRDGGVLLAEVKVGEGGLSVLTVASRPGGAHTRVDVVFQAFEAARDDHVRGRTHGDRDPLGGHAGGEGVIIENGNTVVDPFQAQDFKTRGDVAGRGVLALMPGQAEASGPGETVSRVERRGIVETKLESLKVAAG